jgi:hypothetical protein
MRSDMAAAAVALNESPAGNVFFLLLNPRPKEWKTLGERFRD